MHRQRWGLAACENDFELAVPHLFGHLIGEEQRDAAPACGRRAVRSPDTCRRPVARSAKLTQISTIAGE
jgi:hypothetical protein